MLGWLRAVRTDRAIARFRSRKGGALLAYLAYHQQQSHPRDTLIELLWPDSPWNAGRTNLRTELSWLRRLEPHGAGTGVPARRVLLTEQDTVRLNPESCVTDVALFERALQSAAEARQCVDRVRCLTEAVRLYRGDLLPGLCEAWVVPERLRLTDAFLDAMHRLVVHREQAGDQAGALQLAWRAAGVDPLREETHIDLTRLLVATGQREAALRQCRHRERLLEPDRGSGAHPPSVIPHSAFDPVTQRGLRVHLAEAEELRRQLARRTAENEELQHRLQAEMVEIERLREELAARSAEARELWRQLNEAGPELQDEEWR